MVEGRPAGPFPQGGVLLRHRQRLQGVVHGPAEAPGEPAEPGGDVAGPWFPWWRSPGCGSTRPSPGVSGETCCRAALGCFGTGPGPCRSGPVRCGPPALSGGHTGYWRDDCSGLVINGNWSCRLRRLPEAAPNPAVTPGTSPSAMETTNSLLAPRVTPARVCPAGPGSLPCVPDQPAGPLDRLLGDGRSPAVVFGNPDGVDVHDAGVLDDHLAGGQAHYRRVRRR